MASTNMTRTARELQDRRGKMPPQNSIIPGWRIILKYMFPKPPGEIKIRRYQVKTSPD
jgi:hypothetical protein